MIGQTQILTNLNLQLVPTVSSRSTEEQRSEIIKSFQEIVGNILNQLEEPYTVKETSTAKEYSVLLEKILNLNNQINNL